MNVKPRRRHFIFVKDAVYACTLTFSKRTIIVSGPRMHLHTTRLSSRDVFFVPGIGHVSGVMVIIKTNLTPFDRRFLIMEVSCDDVCAPGWCRIAPLSE